MIIQDMQGTENKIKSLNQIKKIADTAKAKGSVIVTTNGCFDILHVGHVHNLKKAKSHGDILIVGINSDASVRRYKGKSRPIVPQRERAEVLAALGAVDYVFIFDDDTPIPWISKIKPHIHAKGGDRKLSEIVE